MYVPPHEGRTPGIYRGQNTVGSPTKVAPGEPSYTTSVWISLLGNLLLNY